MHSKLNLINSSARLNRQPTFKCPHKQNIRTTKRGSSVINTESTVGDRILTVHSWENLPWDNGSHFHIKLYLSRWKMLKQNTGFLLAICTPCSLPKTFQTFRVYYIHCNTLENSPQSQISQIRLTVKLAKYIF